MGWKERESLGGAPGQTWKDSQESSSLPQPLCSAPHLSQDRRCSWSTQAGLKPAQFSLHPHLFHLHLSFHTSCLMSVASSNQMISLPLLEVLPLNPGGEGEAPNTPDPRGCPRLSPHRKLQPWCGTSTPKTCPGRAGPLSWALGTLQTPGHCPQHFPRQHISSPGIPRWRSSSASPQGQHRGHPCSFTQTGGGMCWDTGGGTDVSHLPQAELGQAKQIQQVPGTGVPLSLHPGTTYPLGWEGYSDILSIPSQSSSLSAGAPRENPRDHNPQFPPSQPREAASGTFPGWLGETLLLSPPWWLQQQLQGRECPIPSRNNSCSTPRAGSHSSAPEFILAGTTGTSARFAAP